MRVADAADGSAAAAVGAGTGGGAGGDSVSSEDVGLLDWMLVERPEMQDILERLVLPLLDPTVGR
jgi:hypothetical protein